MNYFSEGSESRAISLDEATTLLHGMVGRMGPLKRVLLIPPDFTRLHSWAGELTRILYERLHPGAHVEILPAVGTHVPMTETEIETMFGSIPQSAFRKHNWRKGLVHLGDVPGEMVHELSGGRVSYEIPCKMNRLLLEGEWDSIISIGQVVPHEVAGMSNYTKNIIIGTGGGETINKSHFLGAVCDMETIMGRAQTPVRAVLNYMAERFCGHLPITYVLTCRAKDDSGELVTRGIFAGDDAECYEAAAELCANVSISLLDAPLKKTVVYLSADEFKSTWLGNKAIYRTRMAMATGGSLIVLAPGVKTFGEDPDIDRLIRRYGYRGTTEVLRQVSESEDLSANLSAAAHLIHGSSEGRFSITYCTPSSGDTLTREEIESVGFAYAPLEEMESRYDPARLHEGVNLMDDGEEVYYISNPGLSLWALKANFAAEIASN